jgi:hypothetical protein
MIFTALANLNIVRSRSPFFLIFHVIMQSLFTHGAYKWLTTQSVVIHSQSYGQSRKQ